MDRNVCFESVRFGINIIIFWNKKLQSSWLSVNFVWPFKLCRILTTAWLSGCSTFKFFLKSGKFLGSHNFLPFNFHVCQHNRAWRSGIDSTSGSKSNSHSNTSLFGSSCNAMKFVSVLKRKKQQQQFMNATENVLYLPDD